MEDISKDIQKRRNILADAIKQMDEYKDIAEYMNIDGSTVGLEGRVYGNYYTLRIDDTEGLHPVEITRAEARNLIDELLAFIG